MVCYHLPVKQTESMEGGVMELIASSLTANLTPEREWDGLVQTFSEHTVFHQLPWLTLIAAVHDAEPMLLRCMRDDQCEAIWPCFIVHKGPLRMIGSPMPGWNTIYLGPLFKPDADVHAAMQTMLSHRQLKKCAYLACKVRDASRPIDLRPMGFSRITRFETMLLSLEPNEQTLWANFRRQCRNHIRQAMRHNLAIRYESSSSCLNEYWRMTVETFAQSNTSPPFTRRFLHAMWDHLVPAGAMQILSAYHNGERVASIILLRDSHTMYYWAGASYLKYRYLNAHSLMQWEAICHARQAGLQQYDFVSAYGSWGRFKEAFGPRRVPVSTVWERSASRMVTMMKNGYKHYVHCRRQGNRWPMIAALRKAITTTAIASSQ